MLDISRLEIPKCLLEKQTGKTLIRLLLQKQSDLGLPCLSRLIQQVIAVRNFRTFTVTVFGMAIKWLSIFVTFRNKKFFHHLCRTSFTSMKWPLHTSMFWQGLTTMTPTKLYKIITIIIYLILPIFFVLKMLSAFYVCCIYSSALQTGFYHRSKH